MKITKKQLKKILVEEIEKILAEAKEDYEDCMKCNGTGNCPDCEGAGYYEDYDTGREVECDTCGMSGTCQECDSEGIDRRSIDGWLDR